MKNEACIVRPPLALVLQVSRVMGVAPLDFEPIPNGYKISVSKKWAIYSYILITLLNISNIAGLLVDYERRVIKIKNFTTFVFVMPDIMTVVLSTGLGVNSGVRRMKILINNLQYFNKVRTAMNKDYGKRTFQNKTNFIMGTIYLIFMCMFFLMEIYCNAIDYPTEKFLVTAYGIFYLEYLILVVLELQTIFSLLETRSVLELMCEKMNEMLALDESENILVNQEMGQLGRTYIRVCEAISNMNRIDGGIVVLIFANFISSVITSGYYVDILFTELPRYFALIQTTWCCLYAIRVLVILEAFHLINKEIFNAVATYLVFMIQFKWSKPYLEININ